MPSGWSTVTVTASSNASLPSPWTAPPLPPEPPDPLELLDAAVELTSVVVLSEQPTDDERSAAHKVQRYAAFDTTSRIANYFFASCFSTSRWISIPSPGAKSS